MNQFLAIVWWNSQKQFLWEEKMFRWMCHFTFNSFLLSAKYRTAP